MQNVEYIIRCTFLCFVGSFHFSSTLRKGKQRENQDLMRALISRHPLTQIQHHNCKALALIPLAQTIASVSMVILNIIIVGPLHRYHYGSCDPCLDITQSSSTSQSIIFFITSQITFSCLHIHTFTIPCTLISLYVCNILVS